MVRHSLGRIRLAKALVATIAAVPFLGAAAPTMNGAPIQLRAELDGRPVALADVSRYDCHGRAYPLIRCFLSAAERDLDLAETGAGNQTASSGGTDWRLVTAGPYVRWYVDANFAGPSFAAYFSYTHLGAIGWNDRISSFTPSTPGHPRWWGDPGFAGTVWDWGPGVPVAYVGSDANDKFSSAESR